jgi:phi13 family phage major tail protein
MANKIKYGLRNVYYAKVTSVSTEGALTYATPVAMPGAVNLSLSAVGESNPFYADDIIYFQTQSNNGYEGTLEVALLPDTFKTDILGETTKTNGVVVESADKVPAEFALLFEFQGDAAATRHALFRCTCGRPDVASQTKEASITPVTETLNITAMPRMNDYIVKGSCPQSATTAYSAWYSAVVSV